MYCKCLLNDKDQAEDGAQEIFIKGYQDIKDEEGNIIVEYLPQLDIEISLEDFL